MSTSEALKQVAFKVADAFGGTSPSDVKRLYAPGGRDFSDVFRFDDYPVPGVSSYSTVGLSSHPLMDGSREFPGRVEFCGAARSSVSKFANILATAAFDVMDGEFVFPDRIFRDVVSMYVPDSEMKHLVFMTPYLWGSNLRQFDADGRTVAWLQAVPISDGELEYARRHQVRGLLDLMEEREVDVTDFDRAPVA